MLVQRHHLAGPTDPLAEASAQVFNQMITGGGKDTPERADRVEFFSDVFDKTLQKYSASEQGQQTINGAIFKAVVPVAAISVTAFFIGYLLGKRRG